MTTLRDLDLLSFGRAAIDLYGEERGSDLTQAIWFRKSLGGSAANTAVCAARQGLRVAMLTAVGADPLGSHVLEGLRSEGIDTSAVKIVQDRLTALVVLSVQHPTSAPHLFYRERCADMAIGPDDVPEDLVRRVRSVLLTGTHLSTAETFAASLRLLECAHRFACRVLLDLDYRPSLWGAAAPGRGEARAEPSELARLRFREILPFCDVVVGTEEEVCVAAGLEDVEQAEAYLASQVRERVVVKLGSRGARTRSVGGLVHALDGYRVRVLNAIGAGDAFLGAYWAADLRGERSTGAFLMETLPVRWSPRGTDVPRPMPPSVSCRPS
ncbi:MAG: hypothetical protein HC923_01280 [Myxococcales bacterium]|nr:hypothetical protein [Myxococcales bacterium]